MSQEKSKDYTSAAAMINVTGILSIIFGSLGTLVGVALLFMPPTAFDAHSQAEYLFILIAIGLFWVIPHIFLIFSGIALVRRPKPTLAKALSITTIVVGAFLNVILLAFAIIALTQLKAYQDEYTPKS